MGIAFIISTVLTTVYLTFLTAKGGLTDNRHKLWLKKITRRGWIVVGVNIIVVALLVAQYLYSEAQGEKKDKALAIERDARDSTITVRIKAGVDSTRSVLFDAMSSAFSKQNLEFDTVNLAIKRVRDSSGKANREPDPNLNVPKDGIFITVKSPREKKFTVRLVSDNAGSSGFNITVRAMIRLADMRDIVGVPIHPLDKDDVIVKDQGQEIQLTLGDASVKTIYVHVNGSYTTVSRKQRYLIDQVYMYDLPSNDGVLMLKGVLKERVKKQMAASN